MRAQSDINDEPNPGIRSIDMNLPFQSSIGILELHRKQQSMGSNICRLAIAVWLCGMEGVLAVERFVPQGGSPSYQTIQAAINASQAGDLVRVQPGTYRESITFPKANITLTSVNPEEWSVVQSTIIQGNGINSVVTFAAGQSAKTVFTGFTVRGGGGTPVSADFRFGGGIYCFQSSPTIVRNIVEENRLLEVFTNVVSLGGAISCRESSPRISRNLIRNNSAALGGGIVSFSGKPLIQDNWIDHNSANVGGAAYLADGGNFLNNTLVDNVPDCVHVVSTGLVANNIIANYRPATGVTANGGNLSWLRNNDIWEPGGVEVLLNVQTGADSEAVPISLAGTNGNLSVDPRFVSVGSSDFNLSEASPCINAGDLLGLRGSGELDLAGDSRVFAARVDMGASEFRGNRNFPPMADAGRDQLVYLKKLETVILDGTASLDPDGMPLTFKWRQVGGPPLTIQATSAMARFTPTVLGDYRFELVVNDGVQDSSSDALRVVVTNLPPLASAGLGQSLPEIPESLQLDGSHSLDPEGEPLTYHWRQINGPAVTLTTSSSGRATAKPTEAGVYEFGLTVRDAFNASPPDTVTYYVGKVAPIAKAGPTRYAGRNPVVLDGSGSFVPNNSAPLEYAWSIVSGPPVFLSATNVAKPLVKGFTQARTNQEAVFELVVSAGGLVSLPARVRMIIVPKWNNPTLTALTGFKTNRPSIFGFGGGECGTGFGMSEFTAKWLSSANVFTEAYDRDSTSSANDPRYYGYGDQLIVLLSLIAPGYDQPIQTIGYSTGAMPACDVAERFNVDYRDPRYQVNRVTLIDSGCSRDYDADIGKLLTNRMRGKMFWIDNYYSAAGRFRSGALNAEFPVPPADHGTPNSWYIPSWSIGTGYSESRFNMGVFGGAFFSVVGPGKNYQLVTEQSEYGFGWNPPLVAGLGYPPTNLVQLSPVLYPARLPGVVELVGPTNGTLTDAGRVVFSCLPVLNASKYELLVGRDAGRVDQVAWEGTSQPTQPLSKLPFVKTWWTIRVTDAYGTTSWADPRLVGRDSDGDHLSDESEILTFHTNPDLADTDGDGHLDDQELLAGTDPLKRNVGYGIELGLDASGQLKFSWFGDAGTSYDLESTTSLEFPSWQLTQTFVAPVVGGRILHTVPVTTAPSRYYRVRSPARPAAPR